MENKKLILTEKLSVNDLKKTLISGGKVDIVFNELTSFDTMSSFLTEIFSVEKSLHESKVEFEFTILGIKNLPFKDRVGLLRLAIKNEDLLDSTFILNIFNLLKVFNNFDESFFSSPVVFINDFDEFCDMKDGVMEDLEVLNKNIATYFFSLIKTLGVTDFPANNLPKVLPYIYQRIFLISDFISISNMIKKYTLVDNLVYVENAEYFFSTLANRYVFANVLMKNAGFTK